MSTDIPILIVPIVTGRSPHIATAAVCCAVWHLYSSHPKGTQKEGNEIVPTFPRPLSATRSFFGLY